MTIGAGGTIEVVSATHDLGTGMYTILAQVAADVFGLEPHEQVCAWVALTDASREAGCMEHLSGLGSPRQLRHAPLGLANSINRAGQTIMEPFDETDPVAMSLQA